MLMTIRDETATGRAMGSMLLEVLGGITLRELIRLRAREEVARYDAEPTGRFHGLVRPTEADEELPLDDASDVAFVKLVALVGG